MKIQKTTRHLSVDRIDRAMVIYERLGWDIGEEVYCAPFPDSNGRMGLRVLTSKGVIVCKNIQTKVAVTMFVATPHQVRELYGQNRMPTFIANTVLKNQKKFADIIGQFVGQMPHACLGKFKMIY